MMLNTSVEALQDSLKHHCGIVGIHSNHPVNIPEKLFYTLFSIQHRGQESAGIAYRKNNHIVAFKDLGMVSHVLSKYLSGKRSSKCGIGHVRYSTHGGNKLENAQPIIVNCNKGEIAVAHNGTISNTQSIKKSLFDEGSIFQTSSDTELILHLLSRSRKERFQDALVEVLNLVEGALSMVMIHDEMLVGMRDIFGFRPLYIGSNHEVTLIASETCAFDMLQVKEYRSIKPGEIVFIDDEGIRSRFYARSECIRQCVFELIYFARPDSYVFDQPVYTMRKKMGAALTLAETIEGDTVIPVPDSGNTAALGYAEAAGLPFELGLTRNHYAGRSFILPTTAARELTVRMKLHPVKDTIRDKKVVLIDDSLVRGTTSKILVNQLKEVGAKEVHLRLSSPEIKWPCFFGIDIPTRSELISNRMTPEAISDYIGADSVRFLSLEELRNCLPNPESYCFACFNGEYPCDVPLKANERYEEEEHLQIRRC